MLKKHVKPLTITFVLGKEIGMTHRDKRAALDARVAAVETAIKEAEAEFGARQIQQPRSVHKKLLRS